MGWVAAIGAAANVAGGLLGKSSAKKQARRVEQATQQAVGQVQPFQQTGAQANQILGGALGIGGTEASDRAFQNFLGSTGFNQELEAGSRALTGSLAAQGLLDSGDTAKAVTQFGQDLAQSRFQNFLANLGGLSSQGLGAGQVAANLLSGGGAQSAGIRAQGSQAFQSGLGGAFQSVAGGIGNFLGGSNIPTLKSLQVQASAPRNPISL